MKVKMEKDIYKGQDRRKHKRISGRKVLSFIINTIEFASIYFVTLFIAPDLIKVIGTIVIVCQIINTAIFIGGNTLDKITNFKYFNKNE
jgi:hypothetical protein